MTPVFHSAAGHRRRLFLGSAVAALTATIAAPVLASDVEATGAQVIANSQIKADAEIEARAANPVVEVTGEPTDAGVTVSGNTIGATARGNQAGNSLAPDALDLSGVGAGTYLSTGSHDVIGHSSAVVASNQSTDDAPVSAVTEGALIAAGHGEVVESSVAVADNRQEAVALGNDVSSTLAVSGLDGGSGAGIASHQSLGQGSPVTARLTGQASLAAQESVRSDLSLDTNLQRAIGYGNSADNRLSSDTLSIATQSDGMPAIVPSYGSPEVQAAYGLLNHQETASTVEASAEGGFKLRVANPAVGSSIAADGNALIAAGHGNQSANSVSLTANRVAGHGGIANVTNVQQAGAPIIAETDGGANIRLVSDPVDSRVSADGNSIRAIATGNLADGNLLAVKATAIDAGGGEGWTDWPEGEYVGTASYGFDGTLTVTAPFSVQNAQVFEGPVEAAAYHSATRITGGDVFVDSSGSASDNSASVAATGNSGLNALMLEATSLAAAADVNSLQVAGGDVTARLGSASERAGAWITGHSDVGGSSLTVSGNSTAASASANSVSNSMDVTGNLLAGVSGHDDARAGVIDFGTGASADYALANAQIVSPDEGSRWIAAAVAGRFGATGDDVVRSALTVADNSQSAQALANVASNRLAINGTQLGGDDVAPGSALSSMQVGEADVDASSKLVLGMSAAAVDSALSISGNSNTALARINVADNGLAVDAVQIGSLSGDPAWLVVEPDMPGSASGDHVLVNNQYANGNVAAKAVTRVADPDSGAALIRSSYAFTDNVTAAQASANHALNNLSITALADGEASAGLANVQESHAAVEALARTDVDYRPVVVSDASTLIDGNATSALARGNGVTNSLTLTGALADCVDPAHVALAAIDGVSAQGGLLNQQSNAGDVSAYSVNVRYSMALDDASGSSLGVTGNSSTAAAFGNSASNSVTLASLDRLPTAAIGNLQTNSGAVTAQVIGATYRAAPALLTASNVTVSGNIVSASATGNFATNAISVRR